MATTDTDKLHWRQGLGLALVAGLMLTACAPEEETSAEAGFEDGDPANETEEDPDDDAEDVEVTTASAEDSEQDDAAEDETESQHSSASGSVDVEDAIDTVTYSMPREEGTLTVGLHALEVEGDVMVLQLSFTPDFEEEGDQASLYRIHGGRFFPTLNDRENLKKYSVIGDRNDEWSSLGTGATGASIDDADTRHFWAYYAAPEDDIDTINIAVNSAAPEFENVEIDWGDAQPSPEDDQ